MFPGFIPPQMQADQSRQQNPFMFPGNFQFPQQFLNQIPFMFPSNFQLPQQNLPMFPFFIQPILMPIYYPIQVPTMNMPQQYIPCFLTPSQIECLLRNYYGITEEDDVEESIQNQSVFQNNESETQTNQSAIQNNVSETQTNQPAIQNNESKPQANHSAFQNKKPELQQMKSEITESKIYSILCNTIRGAYVSYDAASHAASAIEKEFKGTFSDAYDAICRSVRGSYCSYDRASSCASLIVSTINRNRKTPNH